MLWYKAWLETRWRFLIGLGIMICSAGGTVLEYPQVVKLLLPLASQLDLSGEIGRQVAQAVAVASSGYHGYAWSQWFSQNGPQQWGLFAALLGTGGLLAQAAGGGALFTLSLPVSRNRLLGVRAATGLAELFVLAIVPALVLPVMSPAIGQSYGVGDALVHASCLFIAGSMFFSLAVLMSTVFSDIWRPLLIVVCVAVVAGGLSFVAPQLSVLRVMSAERYFRGVGLPWLGLLTTSAISAALLYAAARNIARQDF